MKISKILKISLLGVLFLKYGIYASELPCDLIKEGEFTVNVPPPCY